MSTGCGNLSPRDNASPRLEQKIDNANGKIERIESNLNTMKFNIEQHYQNSGVQILQGEGGLLLVFGIVTILFATLYFYLKSVKNDKIAKILSEQIKSSNDPNLEENVLKAALYTNVEKDVFHLLYKNPNPEQQPL